MREHDPMSEARAKLYINTGVVTNRSDIYNVLRPLLKQTVTYRYYRGNQIESSGTGWVERIVVDHPEVASYFTPLAICLNLDSFDYLQFDTTSDQLLVYTLVIGEERVVLEFATSAPRTEVVDEGDDAHPLPRTAGELARDLRFIQMELLMSPDASDDDEEA
jgi:hypothetical protein